MYMCEPKSLPPSSDTQERPTPPGSGSDFLHQMSVVLGPYLRVRYTGVSQSGGVGVESVQTC